MSLQEIKQHGFPRAIDGEEVVYMTQDLHLVCGDCAEHPRMSWDQVKSYSHAHAQCEECGAQIH